MTRRNFISSLAVVGFGNLFLPKLADHFVWKSATKYRWEVVLAGPGYNKLPGETVKAVIMNIANPSARECLYGEIVRVMRPQRRRETLGEYVAFADSELRKMGHGLPELLSRAGELQEHVDTLPEDRICMWSDVS